MGQIPEDNYQEPPACGLRDDENYQFNRAIEEGLCFDRVREIHIRLRVWWGANHPFRPLLSATEGTDRCHIVTAVVSRSSAFVDNLERLFALLNSGDPRELMLQAEIRRETGRFDEAITLLENTAEVFYAQQQLELARSKRLNEQERQEWGEFGKDPIWNWSPRAEGLIFIARRIMQSAAEHDALVRTVSRG